MKELKPDYHRIFRDILTKKKPVKTEECLRILEKKNLSALDVIKLNTLVFGKMKNKHRSYSKTTILYMLDFQKENRLPNEHVSRHFNVSRNSVAKWKKLFGY
ncbi:helix-turn-helix domain-containing protein [Chryseobacterium sp. Tr-659]|nr:helix-turn-helix domain-containing protein [Chryseobacterium sp. Tr-659]